MHPRLFQVALVLGTIAPLGPRLVAAQAAPAELQFRLGRFAQGVALSQLDSVGRMRLSAQRPVRRPAVIVSRAAVECSMPVAVPDASGSERMPVARATPAPYAIRQVPPGCVNPLGPPPESTARRTAPTP